MVFRRWRRDERGATMVEFAIIGPVFLLLVMGCIDFGIELMTQMALDSAVQAASRQVAIGAITNQTDFTSAICNNTSTLLANCSSQVQVYVAPGATFSALTPATVKSSGGISTTGFTAPAAGQALLVQAAYVRPYDIPWLTQMLGATPTLLSTVTTMAEPLT